MIVPKYNTSLKQKKFDILNGMEVAWAATKSWFIDHGWQITLIIFSAGLTRRFGMVFIARLITQSLKNSDHYETNRDRKLRANTLISLIGSILKIIIWLAATMLILRELGILQALTPLLAGAGIVSLVIGFGTQTFIKDFVSGVFIVSENQYRVGDVVEIGGGVGVGTVEGTVTGISMRTTTIRDIDGARHVIPNGGIMRTANRTLDSAKINIEVELPISANVDAFEKEANQLGTAMASEQLWYGKILEPPNFYGVQKFTEDKIIVEVRSKTVPAEQWAVSNELKKRLAKLAYENDFFAIKKKPSRKK